jgi:hypothetical protein
VDLDRDPVVDDVLEIPRVLLHPAQPPAARLIQLGHERSSVRTAACRQVPLLLQLGQRVAERDPRDAQLIGKRAFGRETVAGAESPRWMRPQITLAMIRGVVGVRAGGTASQARPPAREPPALTDIRGSP